MARDGKPRKGWLERLANKVRNRSRSPDSRKYIIQGCVQPKQDGQPQDKLDNDDQSASLEPVSARVNLPLQQKRASPEIQHVDLLRGGPLKQPIGNEARDSDAPVAILHEERLKLHSNSIQEQPQPGEPLPSGDPSNGTLSDTDTAESLPVSKSQEIWNEAFKRIEEDPDFSELAKKYQDFLDKMLGDGQHGSSLENKVGPKQDTTAERQAQMVLLVKLGQEKIKRATKITESMGSFVEKILLAKPMVDFMLQNVPQAAPAAVPWAGVCMALDMLCKPAKANKANLDGVKYVTAQMEWYCALTDHILDETKIISQGAPIARILSRLREKTIVLYRKLLLFLMQSVSSYHSHQGLVFIENAAGLEDWSASLSSIKDTESDLKASIEHFIMVQDRDALQTISSRANDTMQILGSLEQTVTSYISYQKNKDRSEADRSLLKKLCVVDTPEDMEEIEDRKDKLLPAASDWILGMPEFKAFVGELVGEPQDATSQSQPSCRLLWIKGHAGTGKTMLLIRIVRELTARSASLSPSVCHFFFQYTNNSLNNSMAALRSLVWMLLLQQPKLLSHLQKKNDNTEINFESRNGFFVLRNIFKSMLQDPGLQPVYFIVDALDECNSHAFPAFDDIIYDSLVITDKVKWLVAGRPTWTLKGHAKSLVELDTQTLKEPVQAYIAHQLAQLKDMDGYTDEIIKDLSAEVNSRADNTYLWVWFIFQSLTKPIYFNRPPNGMHALKAVQACPSGLSNLYGHILKTIGEGDPNDLEFCKTMLRTAFLAYRPLLLEEFAAMVSLSLNQVKRIIRDCGSLITIANNTVSLIHQSAYDYLKEVFVSKLDLTIGGGHTVMGQSCIRAMAGLHKNMYNLPDMGPYQRDTPVPQPDPFESMGYACVYWTRHLCDANMLLSAENALLVHSFLQDHFLHWAESLSLLGHITDGLLSIRKLLPFIPENPQTTDLTNFASDALHFIPRYRYIIELSPLQVYASALLFSPLSSKIRNQFEHEIAWIKVKPKVDAEWGPNIQILDGHTHSVTSVSLSTDGRHLISGSEDETVKFWDVESGECLHSVRASDMPNFHARFFANGTPVANEYHWGTDQRNQDDTMWTVSFALRGDAKISSSGKISVPVYKMDKFFNIVQFFTLQNGSGREIAALLDGTAIKVWDTATRGVLLENESSTFRFPHNITHIAFSGDGKQLATDIDYGTLAVWDVSSGEIVQKLETSGQHGSSVVFEFSPDGKQLAAAYGDGNTRIWNVQSGEIEQTLNRYSDSIVFSPDARVLVFDSMNGSINLLNLAKDDQKKDVNTILETTISPSGEWLASYLADTGIKILKTTSDELALTFRGCAYQDLPLAFSPDENHLAMYSNGTVQIWSVNPAKYKKTLEGNVESSWSNASTAWFVFSPDGSTLALCVDDKIKCWIVSTGECKITLRDIKHKGLAFWQGGRFMAILMVQGRVDVWDLDSGVLTGSEEALGPEIPLRFSFPARSSGIQVRYQTYGLDPTCSWVTKDGQKLLWLPREYRPDNAVDACGSNMALYVKRKKLWFLGF